MREHQKSRKREVDTRKGGRRGRRNSVVVHLSYSFSSTCLGRTSNCEKPSEPAVSSYPRKHSIGEAVAVVIGPKEQKGGEMATKTEVQHTLLCRTYHDIGRGRGQPRRGLNPLMVSLEKVKENILQPANGEKRRRVLVVVVRPRPMPSRRIPECLQVCMAVDEVAYLVDEAARP